MIFRATALSLALLCGIGLLVPLSTDYAQAGGGPTTKPKTLNKKYKKYKKYSKRWWRAYYHRLRKKKAIEARKRTLRLRHLRLVNLAQKTPGAPRSVLKIEDAEPSARADADAADPVIKISDLYILVQGKVKKVFDGDTISIEAADGKVYQVRMLGVDAPDKSVEWGRKSHRRLNGLLLGKEATVIIRKMDSSARYIGTVYSGGEDINLKQIEAGMARYFSRNGYEPMRSDREPYTRAELKARNEGAGLWAAKHKSFGGGGGKSGGSLASKKR
jgi:micrococcal nuclease